MQVELFEPSLGALELGCEPYVVTQMQIGSPAVRAVMRDRALADGSFDDTRFLGARAITVSIRMKHGSSCAADAGDLQEMIDALVPYMSPRVRPTITWQLPGSADSRAAVVRGDSWPFILGGPKHQAIVLQWVCPSGEIFAGGDTAQHCETIQPGTDTEKGRTYDESYADGGRGPYPPSPPIGARTILNPGNATAHWEATIFGAVTNPILTINGTAISFIRNGGLVLAAGQTVVINTRERTILRNGNPIDSAYDRVNYEAWSWGDIKLKPGPNTIRFDGTALGTSATVIICYTPTYLG